MVARVDVALHHSDHPRLWRLSAALDHRVKTLLCSQVVADASAAQATAYEAPTALTELGEAVKVDRLVCAVEGTNAEMDNSRC
jgi:hypothetical protein